MKNPWPKCKCGGEAVLRWLPPINDSIPFDINNNIPMYMKCNVCNVRTSVHQSYLECLEEWKKLRRKRK